MRKIGCLVLVLLLLGCQRDREITPDVVRLIEGKWESVGYQIIRNGEKEWVSDTLRGDADLIFRSDGVPLLGSGLGLCYSPRQLLINGRIFDIEPKSPIPKMFDCELAYHTTCDLIEIQVADSGLLWVGCGGDVIRYRRIL